jgi:predicted alpha/beta-fold hydrolase
MGAPLDPRVVAAYRRQRAAFAAATELMQPGAERVTIPYGSASLHGYLFRAADADVPRPTLIITGGYDSTAEELYFFSAAAAVARGYSCIVFDGPGRGAALIEDRVVFRPDWERVIGPVLDFAVARREVEPAKIALPGISFGGVTARSLYDALVCDKALIEFTRAEGAGAHCEAGARSVFNERAFDWLDATLKR